MSQTVRIFYFIAICLLASQTLPAQQYRFGVVSSFENDSIISAAGYEYIGVTVGSLLSPAIPDSVFRQKVEMVKGLRCKILMCNVLFPGEIKIAGPNVDEQKALTHLEAVLRRAKILGIKNLILGSGGARRIPEAYDVLKAKKDFTALAGKMAALAEKFAVTIILENLNHTETNFINKLSEAADIVRKVNHKSFRLNADIYHMLKEDESPEEIRKAEDLIVYCEIAEESGRTFPGVTKEDFIPYLKALIEIQYQGPILVEGNPKDLAAELISARKYLDSQIEMAKQ